jgi:hypothetical protein
VFPWSEKDVQPLTRSEFDLIPQEVYLWELEKTTQISEPLIGSVDLSSPQFVFLLKDSVPPEKQCLDKTKPKCLKDSAISGRPKGYVTTTSDAKFRLVPRSLTEGAFSLTTSGNNNNDSFDTIPTTKYIVAVQNLSSKDDVKGKFSFGISSQEFTVSPKNSTHFIALAGENIKGEISTNIPAKFIWKIVP